MSTRSTQRTFNDFWGWLLMVRFHLNNPSRQELIDAKADWLLEESGLRQGMRLLDLGCGPGLLGVALADRGLHVTGVDRIASVLDNARRDAGDRDIAFITGDLRTIAFPLRSFDAVLMSDVIGLMGKATEARLFVRIRDWLRPEGLLLFDVPLEPATEVSGWTREFDDGVLEFRSTYDRTSRRLHIEPSFHLPDGEEYILVDPYDETIEAHSGVLRYLYPPAEIEEMLRKTGYTVEILPHPSADTCYLVRGTVGSGDRA